MNKIKVNELALETIKQLSSHPEKFGVEISKLNNGTTIIDMGVQAPGGFEAGRLAAEICLGGLGQAELSFMDFADLVLPAVSVTTNWPAISTLALQAGYPLVEGQDVRLTASGPARALARKPQKIFDFLDFIDDSKTAVIVLQVDCLPSEKVAELIASECHVLPKDLFIVITPGKSVAGATQIAARAIEDVTFTMWEVLHYDVRKVRHMFGMAPIVPVHESTEKAVALPDDFIGYGGRVFVIVEPDEENLDELARNLVFESTPIYGRTFSEILSETNFNFKKVPGYPHIFCPAQVIINDAKTGKISKAGNLNPGMIKKCLGFNNSYCTQ